MRVEGLLDLPVETPLQTIGKRDTQLSAIESAGVIENSSSDLQNLKKNQKQQWQKAAQRPKKVREMYQQKSHFWELEGELDKLLESVSKSDLRVERLGSRIKQDNTQVLQQLSNLTKRVNSQIIDPLRSKLKGSADDLSDSSSSSVPRNLRVPARTQSIDDVAKFKNQLARASLRMNTMLPGEAAAVLLAGAKTDARARRTAPQQLGGDPRGLLRAPLANSGSPSKEN